MLIFTCLKIRDAIYTVILMNGCSMGKKPGSQEKLKKTVLEQSLCTGCGACVGICPYQVIYKDRTVQLFDCDLPDGKCYAFCPRTPADYGKMRESLFNVSDITPEIGAVKNFYLTRASNADLRVRTQHGGTVTALLELAMNEGFIDAAIVSGQNDALEQEGRLIEDQNELRRHTKSKFTVSPTVAAFNRLPDGNSKKIGVVATPCQATALAKMRIAKIPGYTKTDSLNLVIGLFCGWTLIMERFSRLLADYHLSVGSLEKMDIPAGKNLLELVTNQGVISIPMVDVDACIRTACRYCNDSTAEFADLSVGAARYGGDGFEMRGWNQVIIRSQCGQDLFDLARARGVLEIREAPLHALQELKNAAAEKKIKALNNIMEKSRSEKNLLYLSKDDPVVQKYLRFQKHKGKS